MKAKKIISIFGSQNSKLEAFISGQVYLHLSRENGIEYLNIDPLVGNDDIKNVLKILKTEKYQIAFHDNVHPTLSDPGAYFTYSTEKSIDANHWSMTQEHHGWSGGIYQIRDFILAQQIISLIKKEELTRIQISDVVFFSQYDLISEDDSKKKGLEIQEMHRKMTTREIINKISSHDSDQIWESSLEIIAVGQDREALKPLHILSDS